MTSSPNKTVELRLRAAVESAPSGLLMVDAEGRIVLVNREIERLFGYSREELLGRSVDLLVPDGLRPVHEKHRADFFATPSVRAMGVGRDLHGRRKDGSLVPVEIGLTPVATEEGVFVLSSVVDITARRRSEARFRAAVESSPAGMVMVEPDGRIVLVNREIERMFGYPREELLGSSIDRLVPERFRHAHPGLRGSFYGDPKSRAMGAGRELFGLRRDGTEIPVEIGLNPIETDEGLLVLASIVDISARKVEEAIRLELEAQLRQAQKLEAVGTLAGGIAHDFNNILGGIVGYAELLHSGTTDRGSQADLNEILAFTRRGKELVQRILAFSRKQEPAVRESVALPQVVGEVVSLLRSTLGPSIGILAQVDPATPPLLADRVALHQVLMNLGMNAAQAMPEGGEVTFRIQPIYVTDSVARAHPELQEGPYVSVAVRDTGIGMEPAIQARVFEPFFTTKEPGQGSGLGLAIVHGIVRDHGGSVDLESALGKGTSIRCLFPALEAEAPLDVPKGPTISRAAGERVLYVDDEPHLAKLGERRLEAIGYAAHPETLPREALERFRSDPNAWEILVTDYLMPGMTGVQLATAVHQIRPNLPIILLTGFLDDLADDVLAASGISLILRKPVTIDELAEALRSCLSPGGAP